MFEADLSASWLNLQRILNFYSLKNLASNELFFNNIFWIISKIKNFLRTVPKKVIVKVVLPSLALSKSGTMGLRKKVLISA